MRDLQNRRKVKNIAKQKKDIKKKVVKNYLDALNMLNRIGKKNQNSSYVMFLSTNNLRSLA